MYSTHCRGCTAIPALRIPSVVRPLPYVPCTTFLSTVLQWETMTYRQTTFVHEKPSVLSVVLLLAYRLALTADSKFCNKYVLSLLIYYYYTIIYFGL